MRKIVFGLYILGSLSVGLTAASWFTANVACMGMGEPRSQFCSADGVGYVGIFVCFVIITVIYLLVSWGVMRLLGFKITRK